jgi:hypothetical protein
MVNKRQFFRGNAVLAVFALGCDAESALNNGQLAEEVAANDDIDFTPFDDEVTFRSVAENGREVNGTNLNNKRFNNKRFNGTSLGAALGRINGALTSAVRLNATPLTNIEIINGSLLSAFDTGSSTTKVGAQLAGTVFNVNFDPLATGVDEPLTFKIASVVQSGVQSGVYFYAVEQLNVDDDFETLCRDGAGNPTEAIALPGTWDPETATRQAGTGKFTWACRGASLAKAVEWGYRPWVSADLSDAHEAAMRMIRADYFGNGVTHTSNGNAIDVSDKWGIQVSDTDWVIEAKWGPNGAVCLSNPRKLWWPRNSMPEAAALPYCTDNGLIDGTPNYDPSQFGGLLMTRVVPNDNPNAY